MNNPRFSLLDTFPLKTREPLHRDIQLEKFTGKTVTPSVQYNDYVSLLKNIISNDGTGAARSAIEEYLRHSDIYKSWQNAMPYLKDVPHIHGFRNNKRHKNDVNKVNSEILVNGGYLAKNQILYRGGDYKDNKISYKDGPISTSVLPSVALWHAREVTGEIAVLKIVDDNILSFAYKTIKSQKHWAEYEVLIQNNVLLKQTKKHNSTSTQIVEYDVFLNNA